MIVKFIAVLCLILFIPKLEMKKEENDDTEEDDDDAGRKLLTRAYIIKILSIHLLYIIIHSHA